MIKEKLYSTDSISFADYDFDYCEKKDILSKMLENSSPQKVEQVDLTGTNWDLWGEYYDSFEMFINGGKLETSSLISFFIEDFLRFLLQFAYTDDKTLICPFEYESIITAFIAKPADNGYVRISVFYNGDLWKYSPEHKFSSDILVKKDTFLKQMSELLQKIADDSVSKFNKTNYWIREIRYIISELDKYFENPKKFKNEYEPKRHIRVFDIAYKDLNSKWNFTVALEGEREANIMHWEREKNSGRILDYDFIEQYSDNLFNWDKDNNSLVKLSNEEIKKSLKTDMSDRLERNWVYSSMTDNWYSENEVMPFAEKDTPCRIYSPLNYTVEICYDNSDCEDEKIQGYIRDSYDENGNLKEDDLGYLKCILHLQCHNSDFTTINFDYRNNKIIREGLKKALNSQYTRFNLSGSCVKMHLWQYFYLNTKDSDARDLFVACFKHSDIIAENKMLQGFLVYKKEFVECFNKALDEIEHKIQVIKHTIDVGNQLEINKKFSFGRNSKEKFEYIDGFKGGYACVHTSSLACCGIIDKNLNWVVKPEYITIYGKTHPKYGTEIKGFIKKYINLENIDGKRFIGMKNDNKCCVIDINGDLQIPHSRDNIKYTYLNDELYFICTDEDETFIVNEKGETLLHLDFEVGEKFWLFDDIIVISKNKKYGIIDWQGNTIFDFIFSEINPDKDNLDLIPVRYIDKWGFVNKKGEVINLDFPDTLSEVNRKDFKKK